MARTIPNRRAPGCHAALALVLLLALPRGLTGDYQDYSYVLSCQPGNPLLQLSYTFNQDQMFHYDFETSKTVAQLPDFQQWRPLAFNLSTLPDDAEQCQDILSFLDQALTNTMPHARGTPVLDVFTRHPLEFGNPNTLICAVSNFFPPALNITWTRGDVPVTKGVRTTNYYPTGNLDFLIFSYLDITPAPGDRYTCSVIQDNEQYSTIKTWLPRHPMPSELLENALCGTAVCLGILGIIAGIALLVLGSGLRAAE
ncbi:HLA class II histocompatibility antigen, DM alpha chain [Ambystoma mexicanum]|uniref:HLA class II histocompatibility antigen, DM alpha chain n=1 Tax=Ambystoma mexicanum TaxID=8296 RepID=UPI0037E83322